MEVNYFYRKYRDEKCIRKTLLKSKSMPNTNFLHGFGLSNTSVKGETKTSQFRDIGMHQNLGKKKKYILHVINSYVV